jgi:hypothetical protein
VSGNDSPKGLALLGAIAQGAILPGAVKSMSGNSSKGLALLGAIAQGASLPGAVNR